MFKAEANLKDIAVVAVTANAMPRDIEGGIAAGFSDYLTKPLDIAQLYGILDARLLGHRHDSALRCFYSMQSITYMQTFATYTVRFSEYPGNPLDIAKFFNILEHYLPNRTGTNT